MILNTILENIGVPAALEGCAEECSELSQACLKLARKIRNENPTPTDLDSLMMSLNEEIADVLIYIDLLMENDIILESNVNDIIVCKIGRWIERINERKEAPNDNI